MGAVLERGEESAAATAGVVKDLDEAIAGVERAAAHWGVRKDHLEGRFVASLLVAFRWLGRLIEAATSDLKEVVEGARAWSESERAGVREMNENALIALRHVKNSMKEMEIERDNAISRVAQGMGAALVSRTQQWLVMRETTHNRRVAMRQSFITSAVAVVLLFGGYQWWAWEDEPATEALARCVAAKVALASEGRWMCQINELLPRETRSLPKALKDFALVWWPFT